MLKKIFVLGELNVDLIVTGEDVIPEWNREKLVDTFDMVLGSSSAITACGLAGLGLQVYFVGVVGKDPFGSYAIEQLQQRGVDTGYVKAIAEMQTGVTLSLSTRKDRALLTYMGAIPCLKPEHLPADLFDNASHIHFGSYFLQDGMRNGWPDLFAKARNHGITTSFDTGWDPGEEWHKERIIELLKHTDLFMPSEDEIGQIFSSDDVNKVISELPEERGMVAIKRGSKGSVLVHNDGTKHELAAYDVSPIDTTGAGDSFNAGFIYAYLNGKRGIKLLEFANACGGMATLRIGGASNVPSIEEVEAFMTKHLSTERTI